MTLSKIHHIAIIVSNYETAKDFYVNKLNFPIIRENYRPERNDWKLDLRVNEYTELEIFAEPDPPKRVNRPEACGLRHLAFCVESVEQTVKELAEVGIDCEPIRVDAYTGKIEYYGAAEPPVRCGESHLSGLTEPPHFFIKLLCHCWVQSIYFSHREVFSWVNTFNIDLIGIIRYAIHDGIGKSTFTITDLLVPLTFTELRTKDC